MSTKVFHTGAFGTDANTDLIMLYTHVGANNNVSHCQLAFSSSGYQVTAGKTLYMVKIYAAGSGNPSWVKLGYCDNDVGLDTTTARTNGVMAAGLDDTSQTGLYLVPVNGNQAAMVAWDNTAIMFPLAAAGKYPFIRVLGSAPICSYFIWAIEL